jgi:hypothetical protein
MSSKKLTCKILMTLFVSLRYLRIFGRVAQSVWRLTTGWTVRESNPDEGEIFRTCPDRPWGPPSLLCNGYRAFPGGRKLTPQPLLLPRSKKESRIVPLLSLRAFVACKMGDTYLPSYKVTNLALVSTFAVE